MRGLTFATCDRALPPALICRWTSNTVNDKAEARLHGPVPGARAGSRNCAPMHPASGLGGMDRDRAQVTRAQGIPFPVAELPSQQGGPDHAPKRRGPGPWARTSISPPLPVRKTR